MKTTTCETHWVRLHVAGPIEIAKQLIRAECMREGLCVTIEPTCYLYTGGEESGYVVGLNNYPRFPKGSEDLDARGLDLLRKLIEGTHQHSGMMQTPLGTTWLSRRPE